MTIPGPTYDEQQGKANGYRHVNVTRQLAAIAKQQQRSNQGQLRCRDVTEANQEIVRSSNDFVVVRVAGCRLDASSDCHALANRRRSTSSARPLATKQARQRGIVRTIRQCRGARGKRQPHLARPQQTSRRQSPSCPRGHTVIRHEDEPTVQCDLLSLTAFASARQLQRGALSRRHSCKPAP